MNKSIKVLISLCVVVLSATVLIFSIETKPAGTAPVQQQDARFNVLLLGCDESGVRTDSIMLVGVDEAAERISLLSIPRDSKVTLNGQTHKINSALVYADMDEMKRQISQLTGASVDYYIMIKTGVFEKLVDALDGVEYTVEQDMKYSDPSQNLYINLKAGEQTLNGAQCEQYCRYRRYVMGDLTRTQHQQKLLSAFLRQKMNLKYVLKLPTVYNILKENAQTDITPAVAAQNLALVKKLSDGATQIQNLDTPGQYNDMKKEGVSYYLIDQKELQALCKIYYKTL